MVGADDDDAACRFYDAVLGARDFRPARRDEKGRAWYLGSGGAAFMISRPIDGEPACHANGGTIGFSAESPEKVDAWHAAGVANGGTSCEDPPGWREGAFGRLYLAYLRDPAGNKICGLHRPPA